jgi:hypothetical protein
MRRYSIWILVLSALTMTSLCFAQSGHDALIAKEKEAWETFKTKKADAFGNLLGKDFIAVDQDGTVGKSEEVKSVAEFDLKDYALADIKVVMATKDTAVLTYKVTQHGTYKGRAIPANASASSVWVKRGGKWVAVFHQETPARPPGSP